MLRGENVNTQKNIYIYIYMCVCVCVCVCVCGIDDSTIVADF